MNKTTAKLMTELMLGYFVNVGKVEVFWSHEYFELVINHNGSCYIYVVQTPTMLEHALSAIAHGFLETETDIKAALDRILSED